MFCSEFITGFQAGEISKVSLASAFSSWGGVTCRGAPQSCPSDLIWAQIPLNSPLNCPTPLPSPSWPYLFSLGQNQLAVPKKCCFREFAIGQIFIYIYWDGQDNHNKGRVRWSYWSLLWLYADINSSVLSYWPYYNRGSDPVTACTSKSQTAPSSAALERWWTCHNNVKQRQIHCKHKWDSLEYVFAWHWQIAKTPVAVSGDKEIREPVPLTHCRHPQQDEVNFSH